MAMKVSERILVEISKFETCTIQNYYMIIVIHIWNEIKKWWYFKEYIIPTEKEIEFSRIQGIFRIT